jgi:dolichol-phosphate mannosyltransferase
MGRFLRARFTRFVVVGWMGFIVQTAAFVLLTSAAHVCWFGATLAAAELAIAHNFLWHERWTWRRQLREAGCRTNGARTARFIRFNLTSSVFGIAGNTAVVAAAVTWFGMSPLLANVLGTALLGLLHFAIADRWAFNPLPTN